MRIGIFGGAFNPVHIGHINLAENCYNELSLDKLVFVPTSFPPHKSADFLEEPSARLDMLKISISGIEGFEVSDIEFKRDGKSYTYDTLCEMKKLYQNDELFLIMGADQFLTFDLWYRWSDIPDMAHICTCARENEQEKNQIILFAKKLNIKNYYILEAPVLRLSSSEIREKLKNGIDASEFLPKGVYDYILKKELYGV